MAAHPRQIRDEERSNARWETGACWHRSCRRPADWQSEGEDEKKKEERHFLPKRCKRANKRKRRRRKRKRKRSKTHTAAFFFCCSLFSFCAPSLSHGGGGARRREGRGNTQKKQKVRAHTYRTEYCIVGREGKVSLFPHCRLQRSSLFLSQPLIPPPLLWMAAANTVATVTAAGAAEGNDRNKRRERERDGMSDR